MAVFISYSRSDAPFVERLAAELVKNNVHVWLDRWQISVGESITEKIQSAVQDSDHLCVVLSKHSVDSDWCKREINSGLLRELEEKRVLVLPLLIEDCTIPLFLRDKLYADFRSDFAEGLNALIAALASATNPYMGRTASEKRTDTDWGIDWGILNGRFFLRIEAVTIYEDHPFTFLLRIEIHGDDKLTRRFEKYAEAKLDWLMAETVIELLSMVAETQDMRYLVRENQPTHTQLEFQDPRNNVRYGLDIHLRKLGENAPFDHVFDIRDFLENVKADRANRRRDVSEEQRKTLRRILSEPY